MHGQGTDNEPTLPGNLSEIVQYDSAYDKDPEQQRLIAERDRIMSALKEREQEKIRRIEEMMRPYLADHGVSFERIRDRIKKQRLELNSSMRERHSSLLGSKIEEIKKQYESRVNRLRQEISNGTIAQTSVAARRSEMSKLHIEMNEAIRKEESEFTFRSAQSTVLKDEKEKLDELEALGRKLEDYAVIAAKLALRENGYTACWHPTQESNQQRKQCAICYANLD